MSTVEDEAPFILYFIPNDSRFIRDNPTALTLADSKKTFASFFKHEQKFNAEAALKIYYSGRNEQIEDSDVNRRIISVAYGDYLLGCPTLDFGKAVFKADQETKVFQW